MPPGGTSQMFFSWSSCMSTESITVICPLIPFHPPVVPGPIGGESSPLQHFKEGCSITYILQTLSWTFPTSGAFPEKQNQTVSTHSQNLQGLGLYVEADNFAAFWVNDPKWDQGSRLTIKRMEEPRDVCSLRKMEGCVIVQSCNSHWV